MQSHYELQINELSKENYRVAWEQLVKKQECHSESKLIQLKEIFIINEARNLTTTMNGLLSWSHLEGKKTTLIISKMTNF